MNENNGANDVNPHSESSPSEAEQHLAGEQTGESTAAVEALVERERPQGKLATFRREIQNLAESHVSVDAAWRRGGTRGSEEVCDGEV